ncbi:MAG: hypothetical protein R3E75_06480 [Steroidobacteraceae bacterium]|nr:hypothetical protein [Nevskiaceae bacterium]MCP5339208.1 hypothetical protein [Nevskiaceae bacterium]MCP5359451.1 hypothetical protein [Nevskiaceae bacterium]MCP5470882.1 hypothetical protein [Nevskiaceae bacterium]
MEESHWYRSAIIGCARAAILARRCFVAAAIRNDEIPIAAFRKGRTIPRYPLEVVAPMFEQCVQEIPLNHLDLPREQLPQTVEDMKHLLDRNSRWLNKSNYKNKK